MLRNPLFGMFFGLSILVWTIARGADELRTWHPTSGGKEQTIEATATALGNGQLTLRDKQSQKHQVSLSDLSEDERKQALFDVVGRGVAMVSTKDIFDRPLGSGSGFLLSRKGFLLTNYHVIRAAAAIEVKFVGGEESVIANCHAYDPQLDIAILKVAEVPADAHIFTIAHGQPTIGSTAWTLGFPNGILTPDWGAANGVHKSKDLPANLRTWLKAGDDVPWIQTNAVVNQGSSGSPLLDEEGQVLGINTFLAGPQQGFALQIAQASDTFHRAAKSEALALPIPPSNEEPSLAWMSRELTPLLKEHSQAMQKLAMDVAKLPETEQRARLIHFNVQYGRKFLDFARPTPTSWPSKQALLFACGLAQDSDPEAVTLLHEICRFIDTHYLEDRKAYEFSQKFQGVYDPEVLNLLRRIRSVSPHQDVQAHATQTLVFGLIRWLEKEGGLDLNATNKLRQEITELMKELDNEYAEVILGGVPVKESTRGFQQYLTQIHVGLRAQEITGKDVAGNEMKLSAFRGKVVMLDFFADYCPPCRSMYASERELKQQMKERPFALVGVNGDENEVLSQITKGKTITWPSWADGPSGPIATQWNVSAVPTIFLIDGQGMVRRQYTGVPAKQSLNHAIEFLVDEVERR